MKLEVRNLPYLRGQDAKLAEAVEDILKLVGNAATQTAANPSGLVGPPPTISSLAVVAANGMFHAVIQDNRPVLRGISYFIEWSTTPNFAQPHVIFLGPSRSHWMFFGSQTLYFRAYSQYPTGNPSEPVYFGTAASPTAVAGGGALAGPTPLPSPGSGTAPTTGLNGGAGYGHEPTRGKVKF